ncbi:MAG: hypothetical protein LBI39_02255 [Puniceicoccales bacterium]|jgi:hypothetical protein|nr:hypothetical protein [Puniceicoccales bacterium]
MDRYSAYSFASRRHILEEEVAKRLDENGADANADVSAALMDIVTNLGVSKFAIAIFRIIYAVFGWLVRLIKGSDDSLSDGEKQVVDLAKSISEVGGKAHNPKKAALWRELNSFLREAAKDSQPYAMRIMSTIRSRPKDDPITFTAATAEQLVDQLNVKLGTNICMRENCQEIEVANVVAALNGVLQQRRERAESAGAGD